jgi:hypothetical protein
MVDVNYVLQIVLNVQLVKNLYVSLVYKDLLYNFKVILQVVIDVE